MADRFAKTKTLAFDAVSRKARLMGSAYQSIQLTADEIRMLNRQLAKMRHDVNNDLSLLVAAAEMLHRKPELAEKYMQTLLNQPEKISDKIDGFSQLFEAALSINPDGEDFHE